jgi:hypothetical protein
MLSFNNVIKLSRLAKFQLTLNCQFIKVKSLLIVFIPLMLSLSLYSRGGQPFWQMGQIQEQKSSEGQNLVQIGLGGPNF